MRTILASASPRRKEILRQLTPEFEVIPSDGEEIITKTEPSEIVVELASQKAENVIKKVGDSDEGLLLIAADTIVAHQGKILGKPKDEEDAYRMLESLSGDMHQVYTGVCLIHRSAGKEIRHTFFEKTDVEFYPMSGEEIRDYIATDDPMDKAGSYGIQTGCARYIRGISGDYDNVVGMPLGRLYHELKDMDIVLRQTAMGEE